MLQQLRERDEQFETLQREKAELLRLKEAHLSKKQREQMESLLAVQLQQAEEQQSLREDLRVKGSQEQNMGKSRKCTERGLH